MILVPNQVWPSHIFLINDKRFVVIPLPRAQRIRISLILVFFHQLPSSIIGIPRNGITIALMINLQNTIGAHEIFQTVGDHSDHNEGK